MLCLGSAACRGKYADTNTFVQEVILCTCLEDRLSIIAVHVSCLEHAGCWRTCRRSCRETSSPGGS